MNRDDSVYLVQWCLIAAAAWWGYAEGVAGARNVLLAFIWGLMTPGSLFMLYHQEAIVVGLAKRQARGWLSRVLVRALQVGIVCVLVWHGAFATSAALAAACLIGAHIVRLASVVRAARAQT